MKKIFLLLTFSILLHGCTQSTSVDQPPLTQDENSQISAQANIPSFSEPLVSTSQNKEQSLRLARETLALIEQKSPMIKALDPTTDPILYYRGFKNPLDEMISRWPKSFDPEAELYGDLLYCRDAALALMLSGMSKTQHTNTKILQGHRQNFEKSIVSCRLAIDSQTP